MMMSEPIETCNIIAEKYAECFSEPSDHIDDFLKHLSEGAYILDLGCGPGMDAAYMDSKGFKVHAIDGAENMIALAQKKCQHATFEIADMRYIDLGKEQYDGILASYSLIHLPKSDVPAVMANISKALKPSGYFCLGLQMGDAEEVELVEPPDTRQKIFVNVFSRQETHQLLQNHGFTIIEEFTHGAEIEEEFPYLKYCGIARKGR